MIRFVPPRRMPSLLECRVAALACVLLPAAACAIRVWPLSRAIDRFGGSTSLPAAPPSSQLPAEQLARVVRGVAVRLGFACLPQALVVYRLLRHRGLESRVVIGAGTSGGFHAHAWVEHAGGALLGPGDTTALWQAAATARLPRDPR